MAWISIAEADLAERLAAAELVAVQTAATGDAGNPVPEVVASVVAEVRGRVAANPRNKLGPAGTIPAELRAAGFEPVQKIRQLSAHRARQFFSG